MTNIELGSNWRPTSIALHQAAMLLGPIQNALFAKRRNFLQLPMFIQPYGLVSHELPRGGRIKVNFNHQRIDYEVGGGDAKHFAFQDHTQASLYEALLTELKQDELADFFADVESDTLAAGLLTKLHANQGEFLKIEDVTHTDPLTVDSNSTSTFAKMLYDVYTGVARFRAHLEGHMTPIVVWPEHFDLSTLWFHPDNATMDEHDAHINFGFAPFSPGFEKPYLYVYIYPYPDDFEPPALPAPAVWNSDGFRGIVVRFDDLAQQADLAQFVEQLYIGLFDILVPHLKTINA